MRLLVRRYVTAEQRKRDDYGVTEDDVMEIRQDISSLRYELIDILRKNGMKTPEIKYQDVQCNFLDFSLIKKSVLFYVKNSAEKSINWTICFRNTSKHVKQFIFYVSDDVKKCHCGFYKNYFPLRT